MKTLVCAVLFVVSLMLVACSDDTKTSAKDAKVPMVEAKVATETGVVQDAIQAKEVASKIDGIKSTDAKVAQ